MLGVVEQTVPRAQPQPNASLGHSDFIQATEQDAEILALIKINRIFFQRLGAARVKIRRSDRFPRWVHAKQLVITPDSGPAGLRADVEWRGI